MDVWKLFTLSVMSSNKEEYYFITSTLAVPYRLTVATSNPTLPVCTDRIYESSGTKCWVLVKFWASYIIKVLECNITKHQNMRLSCSVSSNNVMLASELVSYQDINK